MIVSSLGRLLLGSGNVRVLSRSTVDRLCCRVRSRRRVRRRYVLSQSTPFISSLYAIFYWKEFKVASKRTWFYEWCMLVCLAVSAVLLCLSE